ncbi:MAG: bifunctional phosphoribosylaminoimidazolecarboxamide formyltransferase/inosine monophosphate cyclohydrolase [Acidobacteria bacterium]|nr:MAG: bifunctional phosphoribosylaminoimidazolecarboxamide formyltransferase/inosine monophosphate cyclohydrolase [Acidobacteriota bacterium]
MPRALLSVSDKTGVLDLAHGLILRGFDLVSTGGTARTLTGAGLAVTSVSDLTGFPEMLDGRVKTLHPAVHGGILARRDRPDHLAALERHGIALVDVVVVNLYPFLDAAAKSDTPFHEMIEEIDIGGPALVRAAAKNFADVLVVVDPQDYGRLLDALDSTPTLQFRFDLMRKAIAHTAAYDTAIADALARVRIEGDRFERGDGVGTDPGRSGDGPGTDPGRTREVVATEAGRSPLDAERLTISLEKVRNLRYGENPHQRAAWYRPACANAPGVFGFSRTTPTHDVTIVQGKELSFTNLLDVDAAVRIVSEFDEPAAVVIKHTNPCGVAIGDSAADAYVRARDADRLAAFGGIVALNRPLDVAAAEAIVSTFIEAVTAPSIDEASVPVLARKQNMRVVVAGFDHLRNSGVEIRSILGGVLAQEEDQVLEARVAWSPSSLPDGVRVVTRRQPSPAEWEALRFAWRICAHVKSNAVIFTDARRTLAIGAGQVSRVDAVSMAVTKAGHANVALGGSVAASDAFFPFRDGLDAVANAGATAVAQPGGSVRDQEVIAAADEHGVAMVFTGRRHFRH